MQHLILLHGALGSKDQFESLAEKLNGDFIIHRFNLTAHGGNEIVDDELSIALFANDVLQCMQQQNIERANIFGYSMAAMQACILRNTILKK